MHIITLFIILVLLIASKYTQKNSNKYSVIFPTNYLVFLFGIISFNLLVFTGVFFPHSTSVFIIYPYGIFTLYLIGPSILLTLTYDKRPPLISYLHYAPALIILFSRIIYCLYYNYVVINVHNPSKIQ